MAETLASGSGRCDGALIWIDPDHVGAAARQAPRQLPCPAPHIQHGLPRAGGRLPGQGAVDQREPDAVQEAVQPPRAHPERIVSVMGPLVHQ